MAKKTAKKTTEETQAQEPKKYKDGTIVGLVHELFVEEPGIPTEECIDAVKEAFPESKFQASHVAYYRNKFRKEGMDIPTSRRGPKAKDEDEDEDENTKPKTKKPAPKRRRKSTAK